MKKYRIFVEKKKNYQTEALSLLDDFNSNLKLNIKSLRLINIYDVFNISKELLEKSLYSVFGEKVTDDIYLDFDLNDANYLAVEYLPGQFDQRADSAMQLISLLDAESDVKVKSGRLIIFDNTVTDVVIKNIKKYYINKIESREKNLHVLEYNDSAEVVLDGIIEGFFNYSSGELKEKYSLAMSANDMDMVKKYFEGEKRNPNLTEIRMLDTYWSDHCRHTTFETKLDIDILDEKIKKAFMDYLQMRTTTNRDSKPITLMDMATINMRYEKQVGNLNDLEISDENNACSIYIDVDVNGEIEKWLLMFKNETHNHPTEIEPFGGASTCIGGAIRDPLSGRSYVYQALRITGSGDIRTDISQTIEGKLPQKVISKKAAAGYSSYGNQIGIPTTYVREIYHEGYIAKRLEVGAVVGACPVNHVKREKPINGDVIILLGGKTGRDGIGGATGSSKEHNDMSLLVSATEVQKGNAPEERKLQRLFRNSIATKLIKKANDFGAGGVSVAIGELADGLVIELDKVPTKYSGLNETEIAISESQERMAVVVDKKDASEFIKLASEENLDAVVVAQVTDNNRLVMTYKGQKVVDISREFINTNGYRESTTSKIEAIDYRNFPERKFNKSLKENILANLSDLNVCSKQGLVEMFDASIGAGTVLMPYGGKYQKTEVQGSVVKIPMLYKETKTCSLMAYGFNPYISSFSPYHGAKYAIIESLSKIVAMGGDYQKVRFTFQEYFEKLGSDPKRWGKPVASLLGAIETLKDFNLASIGGKDSMSGTFKDLDVPPTLISFAVTTLNSDIVVSPEFKQSGSYIYLVKAKYDADFLPKIDELKRNFERINNYINKEIIISAFALEVGGISEALIKMALGNELGINITTTEDLFKYSYGSIVIESKKEITEENFILLGKVTDKDIIINQTLIEKDLIYTALEKPLIDIYPQYGKEFVTDLSICLDCSKKVDPEFSKKEVNVLIPVFPGTNCDYDTANAFKEAGGNINVVVFRNLNGEAVKESIQNLKTAIDKTDILAISGGFSAGDEPDGSGKFIACILNNELIKNSIQNLLKRKGLILGICNGFQALVKSGLLPNGDAIVHESNPTLARNEINRHISKIVKTRVASTNSPWLTSFNVGEVHDIAISHGEGRFIIDQEGAKALFANGQVVFQYCDNEGSISNDERYNPNGSYYAIEGIISKDGLILGKMGHSERKGINVFKNIYGNKCQNIFENAINHFKLGAK